MRSKRIGDFFLTRLTGRTIVKVRRLTDEEAEYYGWESRGTLAIELDDGTVICPSQDDEGNGPGAFFAKKGNKDFYVRAD